MWTKLNIKLIWTVRLTTPFESIPSFPIAYVNKAGTMKTRYKEERMVGSEWVKKSTEKDQTWNVRKEHGINL